MKLIKDTYVSWGAEVVFITSNYQGNQEMMQGCKAAGIPAFVCALLCAASVCDWKYTATGHALGFLIWTLRAGKVFFLVVTPSNLLFIEFNIDNYFFM